MNCGAFVRLNVEPHLQGLWNSDIETQAIFETADPDEGKVRIPHDGNETPTFFDHAYHPPMEQMKAPVPPDGTGRTADPSTTQLT